MKTSWASCLLTHQVRQSSLNLYLRFGPQHCSNGHDEEDTVEGYYYRINITILFLDHLLSEFESR